MDINTNKKSESVTDLTREIQVYKAITAIARLFSKTYDVQKTVEKMIGIIVDLVNADEGAIQILKPASKHTRCTLIRQDPGESRLLDKKLDDFLTGYVLDVGNALLENDLPNLLVIKDLSRRYQKIRSVIGAPIKSASETIGVVNLIRSDKSNQFTDAELQMISQLAAQIGDFLESAEIRQNLFRQNIRLQKNLENKYALHGIIGTSQKFKEVYHILEQVVPTTARVMILGESGTGKELIARCIHYAGPLKDKPFIAVDCGALPASLLESELFGYIRGAFTGAVHDRCGLIEEADGGTLFLDEITNMSIETQAKLLRFIQEEEIRPVGSNQLKKVNVRIIVAASAEMTGNLSPKHIRPDLFYRLNVISIHMPPLRERIEDIPILANTFLARFTKKHGKALKKIAPAALQYLENYSWPGNIRELENLIERAVVMCDYQASELLPENLAVDLTDKKRIDKTAGATDFDSIMCGYERKVLEAALKAHHGNQAAAAKALNISESGLRYKLKRLNLKNNGLNSPD